MHIEEKKASIDLESFEFSEKFRRNINRIFREQLGAKNRIPHPEVDNIFERMRSRIIRFFLVITGQKKK